MCLDIIVLVVIMYSILGGYKSSFCCQDNKEELGIVTTITSILFLDGVDYVLVTQTLVTYQVTCKGKVNRLNGFHILYLVSILNPIIFNIIRWMAETIGQTMMFQALLFFIISFKIQACKYKSMQNSRGC